MLINADKFHLNIVLKHFTHSDQPTKCSEKPPKRFPDQYTSFCFPVTVDSQLVYEQSAFVFESFLGHSSYLGRHILNFLGSYSVFCSLPKQTNSLYYDYSCRNVAACGVYLVG